MHQAQTSAQPSAYTDSSAINEYSTYRLIPEEVYFFEKYYQPNDRIADLGCGLGRTTLRLHERGCRVTGLDLSQPFIDLASARFPAIDFRCGDFSNTGLLSGSFDHVLIAFNSLDCVQPLALRERALTEAHRLLRPGGTLLYSSHNLRSLLMSPKYASLSMNLWRLRNYSKALLGEQAYLDDRWNGSDLFYSTPAYAVRQTEALGFQLVEHVGLRASAQPFVRDWLSPHVHYLFRKR
jgi:SAM-dependent methyltransferase